MQRPLHTRHKKMIMHSWLKNVCFACVRFTAVTNDNWTNVKEMTGQYTAQYLIGKFDVSCIFLF